MTFVIPAPIPIPIPMPRFQSQDLKMTIFKANKKYKSNANLRMNYVKQSNKQN